MIIKNSTLGVLYKNDKIVVFATTLSKNWNETIVCLESNKLNVWAHNKTIQKARESRKITAIQKEYLKSLKI